MGESRTWLPTLPAEVLSLGAIESVFTFIMSKKFTREDKHRDEIIQMEEGSRTRSHRWDESALQGVDVEHKGTTRKARRPRERRSPTPSRNQRASSGSAPKRHYPPKRSYSRHDPPE